MNTWFQFLNRPSRALLFPALAVLALATTGCNLFLYEDEGDKEPKLAEYRVSVSPDRVVVPPEFFKTVTLRVECVGDNLPPGCAANRPNWRCTPVGQRLAATVTDASARETSVTIWMSTDISSTPNSLGNTYSEYVTFKPRNVPANLTLTGRRFVEVVFLPPGGERGEVVSGEPRMGAFPDIVSFPRPGPGEESGVVRGFQVVYFGPTTELLDIVAVGPELGYYTIARPSMPLRMDNAFMLDVKVIAKWATAPNKVTFVNFIAKNGAKTTVVLKPN